MPRVPQLVLWWTRGIVSRVDRLTGWQQVEMAVPGCSVVGKRVETRIPDEVAGWSVMVQPVVLPIRLLPYEVPVNAQSDAE
jgi:hypothetical protein